MIIRSSVDELLCSCEERRTCVGFNTVSGYTPLVEVNQAIFAWSFRQISVYPRENLSTLKIMRSVPAGPSYRKH